MNEITYKHYIKYFKEHDPMKLSPYDRSRPYKKEKIGILTSKM
ncbi:hypothetical protein [Methanobrevibacter sp.]|nr:hypothetical protein [Methanobrevibacter sp.]